MRSPITERHHCHREAGGFVDVQEQIKGRSDAYRCIIMLYLSVKCM